MSRILCLSTLTIGVMLLAGCQTARPLYHWGSYEAGLYSSYAKPGKLTVEERIAQLEADVRAAKAKGVPPHPGLHAQLGYLYLQKGDAGTARGHFETEKALFPEATALMDRLIGKLSAPQQT